MSKRVMLLDKNLKQLVVELLDVVVSKLNTLSQTQITIYFRNLSKPDVPTHQVSFVVQDHELLDYPDGILSYLSESFYYDILTFCEGKPSPSLFFEIKNLVSFLENPAYHVVNDNSVSSQTRNLPGMGKVVPMPCDHPVNLTLWAGVQHLNDTHQWSREKIADWLDELHDSGVVNLEFEPWGDEGPKEKTKPKVGFKYTNNNLIMYNKTQTHYSLGLDGTITFNATQGE
jgi:hypothetical protein